VGRQRQIQHEPSQNAKASNLASHNNVVQVIRQGGFMPSTAGNRQPFGMPPYGQVLNNDEIAAVATFIRQSWRDARREAPLAARHAVDLTFEVIHART
jgi:mono/diheme cytochrome c family protein